MSSLPSCIEAEKVLLGAIFMESEKIRVAKKFITAEDFFLPKHVELFRVFEQCFADNAGILDNGMFDIVVLEDILEKRGTLEKVGGLEYVVELTHLLEGFGNEETYARQIRDRSERRKIIALCSQVVQECRNIDSNINAAIDKLLSGATEARQKAENVTNFSNALYNYFELLRSRNAEGNRCPGIKTGFSRADMLLGGMEDGKLYIIGGRPGMGKTAFALNVAENIAQKRKTVALFSLEMGENEVMKRVVSSVAGINSYVLKMASCSEKEIRKIPDILGKIESSSMYICDDSYQTADSIYSTCLDVNAQLQHCDKQIGVVVIDYLQLISPTNKREDRRSTIGNVSRACKIMAKKLNCPVILISQLSRACEARDDKRPRLSDLRESGEIEQDADAVMFLYREEHYESTPHNKGKAELIIAKNRDGERGTIRLRWYPQILKFEEAEPPITQTREA